MFVSKNELAHGILSETGSMGPTDAMNTVLFLVVRAVDNILCSLATAALDR